jgi:hypothetical protein
MSSEIDIGKRNLRQWLIPIACVVASFAGAAVAAGAVAYAFRPQPHQPTGIVEKPSEQPVIDKVKEREEHRRKIAEQMLVLISVENAMRVKEAIEEVDRVRPILQTAIEKAEAKMGIAGNHSLLQRLLSVELCLQEHGRFVVGSDGETDFRKIERTFYEDIAEWLRLVEKVEARLFIVPRDGELIAVRYERVNAKLQLVDQIFRQLDEAKKE